MKALVIAALPLVLFLAIGALIEQVSHRKDAHLARQNGFRNGCIRTAAAPNFRLLGYHHESFRAYWRVLGDPRFGDTTSTRVKCPVASAAVASTDAWNAEKKFLWLDLGFPLFYGGALLAALLLAWNALGRPFRRTWVVAPALTLMVADWIENSVHLWQISRWEAAGETALSSAWIEISSAATVLKIALIGVCVLGLVALLVWYVARGAAAAEPRVHTWAARE